MSKIWGPAGDFLGSIGDGPQSIMPGDGCINPLGCLAAPFILLIMWPVWKIILELIPGFIGVMFEVFFVILWPIGWGAVLIVVAMIIASNRS